MSTPLMTGPDSSYGKEPASMVVFRAPSSSHDRATRTNMRISFGNLIFGLSAATRLKCVVAGVMSLVLVFGLVHHLLMLWRLAPEGHGAIWRCAAVAIVLWIAPGICWLRWGVRQSRSLLDQALLVATVSTATSAIFLWFLYMAGAYSAGVAQFMVIIGLALSLLAFPWRHLPRLPRRLVDSITSCSWPDLAVLLLALAFCAGIAITTTGHPLTSWDAIVSWDKWACDMAERERFGNYLLGGYPQLLPSLCSLLHKFSGTALASFPDEQLLMHNFAAPFALLLVLALTRLCRLWSASAAICLLLAMSLGPLQAWWRSGYVDIPATAYIVAAIALLTAVARSELVFRKAMAPLFIGLVLFAVGFTKGYGLAWLVLIPLLVAIQSRAAPAFRQQGWKHLLAGLLAAVLLLLPFYLQQRWLNSHVERIDLDPRLHTFTVSVDKSVLYDQSPRALSQRAREALSGFGQLPSRAQEWIAPGHRSALIAAGMVLGASSLPGLALTGSIGLQWWMWETTSAYDTRNLIPALVLLCVVIAMGGPRLPGRTGALGRLIYGLVVMAIAGPWILQEGKSLCHVLRPSSSRSLLKVWSRNPDQRLRAVAPHQFYLKVLLEQSPLGRRASRIYAPDELYRHLGQRGIYTLKGNVFTRVTQGDLLLRNTNDPSPQGFVALATLKYPGYASLSCQQPNLAPTPWSLRTGDSALRTNPVDTALTTSQPILLSCPHLNEMGSGDVLIVAVQFDTPEQAGRCSLQLPEAWDTLTHLRSGLAPIQDGCWIRLVIWLDRGEGFTLPNTIDRAIALQIPPGSNITIRRVETELIRAGGSALDH